MKVKFLPQRRISPGETCDVFKVTFSITLLNHIRIKPCFISDWWIQKVWDEKGQSFITLAHLRQHLSSSASQHFEETVDLVRVPAEARQQEVEVDQARDVVLSQVITGERERGHRCGERTHLQSKRGQKGMGSKWEETCIRKEREGF